MTSPVLEFAVTVEDEGWGSEPDMIERVSQVLDPAAAFLAESERQPFPAEAVEVSLLFTDDDTMAGINGRWRGKDRPTNVLSFPALQISPGMRPGPILGDIILARQTVEREAAGLGKPVDDHIAHLLVHGFLHLFGYDHIDAADAEKMEGLETRILAELGLSDPYGDTEPDTNDV